MDSPPTTPVDLEIPAQQTLPFKCMLISLVVITTVMIAVVVGITISDLYPSLDVGRIIPLVSLSTLYLFAVCVALFLGIKQCRSTNNEFSA